MPVICRKIVENEESHFYRFICEDVYFSNLQYYANSKGNNKTRKKYSDYISKTSIGTQQREGSTPKLVLPINAQNKIERMQIISRRGWVLCYHNIESLNFIYLFPCKSNRAHPSQVIEQDLPEIGVKNHQYDFKADKIYIWHQTVTLDVDSQVTGSLVFSYIDRFFLELKVADTKQVSLFYSEEEQPSKLYFDLFLDEEGNLLYLKNVYKVAPDITTPDCIHLFPGGEWKNDKRLKIRNRRSLDEVMDRRFIPNWVSG